MATVGVGLAPPPRVSSIPTLRSLSGSSVRSGLISLIAPTRVVFPTPKPPEMRILAVAGTVPPSGVPSKRFKSIEHHPQEPLIGYLLSLRGGDPDHPLAGEVAEQRPDRPEGEVDFRGQAHDRRGAAAHAEDPPVLRAG